MIGATTLDEYRKHIEKDAALERRFQQVLVDEPNVEDTISILRGLRERLEVFHGVKIQDTALVSAATLSHRYITDRFLPDKAIDLVDEACARLRTEIDSMPAELDEITRRVTRLEIEEAALSKESDPASRTRLEELRRNWPTCAARPTPNTPSGRPNGRRSAACRNCARNWSRSATRRRRPNAPTTSTVPPNSATAASRTWSADSPQRRSNWPPSKGRTGCCARSSPRRRSPRSSPPGPASPSPASRRRTRETAAPRRHPARARHRPERGRQTRHRRHHPRPLWHPRPSPPHRLVHLPRPHRRREDRAGQDPRPDSVRLRGEHGPPRHE